MKHFDFARLTVEIQGRLTTIPVLIVAVTVIDVILLAAGLSIASLLYTNDRHIARERMDIEAQETQITSWRRLAPQTESQINLLRRQIGPACDAAQDTNAFLVRLIDHVPNIQISHLTLPRGTPESRGTMLSQTTFSATLVGSYRALILGLATLDRAPVPVTINDYHLDREAKTLTMTVDLAVSLPPQEICASS